MTILGFLCKTITPDTPPAVWPVLTLDRTGNTIPTHNYADVPTANAVYLAPRSGQPAGSAAGSDAGTGAIGAPYATITQALNATTSTRNVIVCRGGTIGGVGHASDASHGTSIFSARGVTIQSYRNEQVWFDGNNTVQNFGIFACNGTVMTHTIRGLGFRNYIGNNNLANGGCMYLSSGTNNNATIIVEDCVFKNIGGTAVDWFKPRGDRGARMTRCVVRDCDSTGITGTHFSGGQFQAAAPNALVYPFRNDMLFEDLYIARCNTGNHIDGQPGDTGSYAGSFQAGAKIHGYLGCTFKGCIIENINETGEYGAGIWFDVGNREVNVVNSLARNCARAGFFTEVGQETTFANLLTYNCGYGQYHGNFRIATRTPRVYHCTSVGGAVPIEFYDDIRSQTSDGYGPDTDNCVLVNNLFAGPTTGPTGSIGGSTRLIFLFSDGAKTAADPPNFVAGTSTRPSQFFDGAGAWDKNAWWKSTVPNVCRWDEPAGGVAPTGSKSYATTTLLHADRPDAAATDLTLAADPFVDHVQYKVAASSPAYNAGLPLPADIAALIGKPTGSVHSLGYIDVPFY